MATRSFTSAKTLAAYQRERGERVVQVMEITFKAETERTRLYARDLLSGLYRQEDLRRMGDPYSRHALSPLKALPINVDTGRLRDSMQFTWSRVNGVTTYRLWNNAPYAPFILSPTGTKNMIARPFWEALTRYYQQNALQQLRKAFSQAHS
jgi:hypothetical protein